MLRKELRKQIADAKPKITILFTLKVLILFYRFKKWTYLEHRELFLTENSHQIRSPRPHKGQQKIYQTA
jgi:hypothetical protein